MSVFPEIIHHLHHSLLLKSDIFLVPEVLSNIAMQIMKPAFMRLIKFIHLRIDKPLLILIF